jgi:glycerate 2-kinase
MGRPRSAAPTNMTKHDLHHAALEIFASAMRSVDAQVATRSALSLNGSVLKIGQSEIRISGREVYAIAIGKASVAMTMGLLEVLTDEITAGLIVGPTIVPQDSFDPVRWQFIRGGHPLPTQRSLDAAQAAIRLLHRANDSRGVVLFLISGGGSAMIEWPRDERITLDDLREANRQLVQCGASIAEINAVRRAFSAVKGGRLAALAPDVEQITLIISDTNRGDEASVASGPTMPPPTDRPEAMEVVERYSHRLSLPPSVITTIQDAESEKERAQRTDTKHYVLLDNQSAIEAAAAAARQLGFDVEVAYDINEQPIEEGTALLISRLRSLWDQRGGEQKGACLISGGEFSCPVIGEGVGGRNLETVLRCAIEFGKSTWTGDVASPQLLALSVGTDGIDGNSPAAGALADDSTIARALSRGLDANCYLKNSDSFTFFDTLGDAIICGPTGTNVRDLRILLAR